MRNATRTFWGILILLTALIFIAGCVLIEGCCKMCCGPDKGIQSATIQVGPRSVSATVQGCSPFSLESKPQTNTAIVILNKHELVVEKARATLDGKELAKIPPAAAKVEVVYLAGKLTITADSQEILTMPLKK